jgi:hypothetical protein
MKIPHVSYVFVVVLVATLNSGTLPNSKFTPGETVNAMLSWVCNHFLDSLPPSKSNMIKAYSNYNINVNDSNYKLNYLIPISLGGANTVKNMWPIPINEWFEKNKIENDIFYNVCNGKLSLKEAQILLAKDWTSWQKEDMLISGTFTKDSFKIKKDTLKNIKKQVHKK